MPPSRPDTIVSYIGGCLTRAEATPPGFLTRTKVRFSSRPEPSGLAPLAGEAAKLERKESALMRRNEADGNTAVSEPRCEIEKFVLDKACERPGDVRYRGMLLCAPHAALLGLEARAEALLGTVYRMDEWMEENGNSAADDEFVGRVRHEREEAVGALRLTRAQLRSARKALSVGR